MFEILHREWNSQPIFTQKWASVDMNWGVEPQSPTIPTLTVIRNVNSVRSSWGYNYPRRDITDQVQKWWVTFQLNIKDSNLPQTLSTPLGDAGGLVSHVSAYTWSLWSSVSQPRNKVVHRSHHDVARRCWTMDMRRTCRISPSDIICVKIYHSDQIVSCFISRKRPEMFHDFYITDSPYHFCLFWLLILLIFLTLDCVLISLFHYWWSNIYCRFERNCYISMS